MNKHTLSQSNAHTAALRLAAAESQLFVQDAEGSHEVERSHPSQRDELRCLAVKSADTVHH